MSIDRLDNTIYSFLRAYDLWKDDPSHAMRMEITAPNDHLLDRLDPAKLQGLLDRHGEQRFYPADIDFIRSMNVFDDGFVSYLKELPAPMVKVFAKDRDIKVRVDGTAPNVALWKTPILTQIRDLWYGAVAEEEGYDVAGLIVEGGRRFQVKGDMIRNSGLSFVEAGTDWRYTYDWYTFLIPVIIGDLRNQCRGTTNLRTAFAFGLPIQHHDPLTTSRLVNPSVEEVGIALAAIDTPVIVSEANAFQMAHIYGHFGDKLSFEWDKDLTSDMGPTGAVLDLETTTYY